MELLFQPSRIFLLQVLIILGAIFLVVRRALRQRADQKEAASRQQNQPFPEILLSLEKINSTLERIERKLEPTRKVD